MARDDQSFLHACRELIGEFRRSFRQNRLKAIGGAIGFLASLVVVFLVGFFLFGGWVIFEDRLPDWVGRLLISFFVVLVAWSFLKPVFDRWERIERSKRLSRRSSEATDELSRPRRLSAAL